MLFKKGFFFSHVSVCFHSYCLFCPHGSLYLMPSSVVFGVQQNCSVVLCVRVLSLFCLLNKSVLLHSPFLSSHLPARRNKILNLKQIWI